MRKVKYVKRRQRGAAVLLASLILLLGAAIYIGTQLATTSTRDYKGSGNGQYELITVKDGQTLSELGPELKQRGIIANESVFQTATYNNPNASNFKPGVYRLQHEMSVKAALAALLDPKNKIEALAVNGGDGLMDVKGVGGGEKRCTLRHLLQDLQSNVLRKLRPLHHYRSTTTRSLDS